MGGVGAAAHMKRRTSNITIADGATTVTPWAAINYDGAEYAASIFGMTKRGLNMLFKREPAYAKRMPRHLVGLLLIPVTVTMCSPWA